jgi:hypothetical protein
MFLALLGDPTDATCDGNDQPALALTTEALAATMTNCFEGYVLPKRLQRRHSTRAFVASTSIWQPAAMTRTNNSVGRGWGRSISTSSRLSGPPHALCLTAFIEGLAMNDIHHIVGNLMLREAGPSARLPERLLRDQEVPKAPAQAEKGVQAPTSG